MSEKITLNFLGTGQAVPTAKRNHTAILLQYKDENILIDCGEGTQRQFRIAKLNPCKITKILITHWHGDHTLGIPGLLQTLALNNYQKTLEIYGPKGTNFFMEKILQYFVPDKTLKLKIHEVQGRFLETKEFFIQAEQMEHRTNCNAYSFIEKEKLRLNKTQLKKLKLPNSPLIAELQQGKDIEFNGKKIKAKEVTYKQEQRKVTFILDTKINNNCIKIADNSNLLISEAVYLEQDKELAEEYKHLTTKQAGEIAKKSSSKKLILTHLSQRYEEIPQVLLKETKKVFKNTQIAEDFMVVEI